VLDIAPGWLFEDVPDAKPRSTAETRTIEGAITDFHADNLAPRLIGLWKRLPPELKRAMLALMIAMAQRTRA
jgi:uncharacterized protein HemY